MSALALLKRVWLWGGLVLLCALVSFAAFVAPKKIGEMELERDARTVSARIGAKLQVEPGTLIDAFARPALAPRVSRIFSDLGYGHRVVRYGFYDNTGNLTFTSGKAGLQLEQEVEGARQIPPVTVPTVALYNRSDAAVSHFALLTIPLRMGGQANGTLLVYLDQSDEAKVLSRYFGLIAAVTMLLLGSKRCHANRLGLDAE